ncbi:MAG: GTP-binding protein [Gammaproteobacteria bacterium]|nr:GTP-binding protein [Gammaproteobacteria bacterium]
MKTRKICMIGDFAIGKTSLVGRFVRQAFGEQYLTTVGVKIDTRELSLPSGDELKLVLWDIAGKSALADIDTNYLRDASGYLLVADGTRGETLDSALTLHDTVRTRLGDVPFCLLLNKADLDAQWTVDRERLAALKAQSWPLRETSALSGDGVENAFIRLGQQLLHAV